MTNEELALTIQNDGPELIEELWLQVERFIKSQAKNFYYSHQLRCDQMCVDAEDLYQIGYFALLNATEKFRDDAGSSFINYLAYHLKAQFCSVCKMNYTGWQNNKIRQAGELDDVLANTISVDSDMAEEVTRKVYLEQAKADVAEAVEALTDSQKETITLIYFDGLTYQACADKLGLSKGSISRSAQRAFVHLRKSLSAYEKEVA